MKRLIAVTWALALIAACGAEVSDTTPTKPVANPDDTVGERADGLSNYWTDIVGEIEANGTPLEASIDYPSYFHGYTVELSEGDEVNVSVTASADGYVRLYGPGFGSRPYFGRAKVKDYIRGTTEFTYTVPTTGTYMVLYGPEYVWQADYTISVDTIGDPRCFDDGECAGGEYCGDNGVRCITFPCDVNFNICKPREGDGAWCDRDSVCADGLACANNVCALPTNQCQDSSDCAGEFCGYDATGGRLCKPFADEGGRCGGFVRPQDVEACAPEHQCLGPDFIADMPGFCGQDVTVAELRANPAAYDGSFVGLKGYIGSSYAICTQMACSPSNPCCNACGASQMLYDDAADSQSNAGVRLEENGAELTCSGDECSYADNCTADEGINWVGGWFHADSSGGTIDIVRRMQGF